MLPTIAAGDRLRIGRVEVIVASSGEQTLTLTEARKLLEGAPAVRRPVAVATLTMLFALAGRLLEKNELSHTGRWSDRTAYMGQGLTSRTLGIVGAGSIGQEILRLSKPFFKKMVAADT